jgi:hypothetical protein
MSFVTKRTHFDSNGTAKPLNKWLIEKNRRMGGKYLGSPEHASDITTTVAVNRLKLNERWGNLSSAEYESLCKEIRGIQQEKMSSKSHAKVMDEFNSIDPDADIYSMPKPEVKEND